MPLKEKEAELLDLVETINANTFIPAVLFNRDETIESIYKARDKLNEIIGVLRGEIRIPKVAVR